MIWPADFLDLGTRANPNLDNSLLFYGLGTDQTDAEPDTHKNRSTPQGLSSAM